jgi:hypothetical protein
LVSQNSQFLEHFIIRLAELELVQDLDPQLEIERVRVGQNLITNLYGKTVMSQIFLQKNLKQNIVPVYNDTV